jgi:hypothetical protein
MKEYIMFTVDKGQDPRVDTNNSTWVRDELKDYEASYVEAMRVEHSDAGTSMQDYFILSAAYENVVKDLLMQVKGINTYLFLKEHRHGLLKAYKRHKELKEEDFQGFMRAVPEAVAEKQVEHFYRQDIETSFAILKKDFTMVEDTAMYYDYLADGGKDSFAVHITRDKELRSA